METQTTNDDTTSADHPPAARVSARLGEPLTLLAAAVALILIAALVLSLVELSDKNSKVSSLNHQNSLRQTALQAADQDGVYFASYNYSDLNGPTAAWTLFEKHCTPAFLIDFKKTSSALASSIVAYKATAKATVPAAGVSSVIGDRAIVMLQISQTITNSAQGKNGPQTPVFLVIMTLLQQKGHWYVDNVQVPVSS